MAIVEDAASVLEQFVQDVANLPAEIAHLLEEIQAKDRVLQECRGVINTRDNSIQKWMKVNGTSQLNPKEEPYSRTILANFDKAQTIQEEKVGLSAKVAVLLDRQIKRLDLKIRDLQNEGTLAIDPTLPSLLNPTVGNRLPPISTSTTIASTPLNPLSGNAGPSTTIANNPLLSRLVQPPQQSQRPASPAVPGSLQPHHSHLASNLTPAVPASTIHLQNRARESSAGASDAKRRRLTAHLPLPTTSSNLRQSSLGPGTPKAGTPSAARGGSAGPRPGGLKKAGKKVAPHQRVHSLNPSAAKHKNRRRSKKVGGLGTGSMKPSPSDTTGDDESVLSDVEGSEDEHMSQGGVAREDVEMEDVGAAEGGDEDDGGDDRKYCTCRSVSYGNMVACDNPECPYEWFHWSCVGMTKEPVGTWFCEECRNKML